MSKIRVKNFGPIKEGFNEDDGFLDVKKVTVFIGNQGTGKSTVAKLISTCKWLEKAMNRGDIEIHMGVADFREYCGFQNIQNYFKADISEVDYKGEIFQITYNEEDYFPDLHVMKSSIDDYNVPKLMYIPAERNFLSAVKDAFNVTGLAPALFSFGEELRRSQIELKGETVELPIEGYKYLYEETGDFSLVITEDEPINLLEASSGFQSAVPLFIVSKNLASLINRPFSTVSNKMSISQIIRRDNEVRKLLNDKTLSDETRTRMVDKMLAKYQNACFINIVEEPEQNLFPDSQRQILNSLLGFANRQEANELLMTTHSPYIINYLSIAIQGRQLLDKINGSSKKEELLPRLNQIVPIEACVAAEDVAVYQFQNDGSICRLGSYEGIPSDKNYLNQSLAEGNQLFDALLELEEEL